MVHKTGFDMQLRWDMQEASRSRARGQIDRLYQFIERQNDKDILLIYERMCICKYGRVVDLFPDPSYSEAIKRHIRQFFSQGEGELFSLIQPFQNEQLPFFVELRRACAELNPPAR
jgi:hypothetical protein